jgi:hypothetical protein
MNKPAYIASLIVICTAFIFLFTAGFWSFYPYKIMEIKNPQSLVVDKEIYQAGDRIAYVLDYCKYKRIQGTVSRSLVDGILVNYSPLISDLETGCFKLKRNDLVIPEFTPTGIYHISSSVEYKINPLRTITITYRTVDFQVENTTYDDIELHEEQDQQQFKSLQKQINDI